MSISIPIFSPDPWGTSIPPGVAPATLPLLGSASPDGSVTPGPPPGLAVTPERIEAALRWRARRLLRGVQTRESDAIRMVPALLRWRFPFNALQTDAVCGVGFRANLRSHREASRMGLSVPAVEGRRFDGPVISLFVLPEKSTLTGIALLSKASSPSRINYAEARVQAIHRYLVSSTAQTMLKPVREDSAEWEVLRARLAAFGGLLAGRLPASFLEPGSIPLSQILSEAPTPLARLFLALVGQKEVSPVTALSKALARHESRELADAERFCGAWAAETPGFADLVTRTLACAAEHSATRERALSRLDADQRPGGENLLRLARDLIVRSGQTIASFAGPHDPLRTWWWREVAFGGAPAALIPALAAAIRLPCRTEPAETAKGTPCFDVKDARGARVARGRTLDGARVRGSAALARVFGAAAPAPDEDTACREIIPDLVQPPEREHAWLVVDSKEVAGNGGDLLNRGPERLSTVATARVVRLTPNRPISCRVIDRLEAATMVAREKAMEVVAVRAEARPLAARLAHVGNALAGAPPETPRIVESAGSVYLLEGSKTRRWPLEMWARRPRRGLHDPEAEDLSVAPGVLPPAPEFSGNGLGCFCSLGDDGRVTVLYRDRATVMLRERVEPIFLPEYLMGTERILASAPVSTPLALRMTSAVGEALSRRVPPPDPKVAVTVEGDLPFGLRIEMLGARFGAGAGSWRAAAEAILSVWPVHGRGRVVVSAVKITVRNEPATGIQLLYARSVVSRRLEAHIGILLRTLGGRAK